MRYGERPNLSRGADELRPDRRPRQTRDRGHTSLRHSRRAWTTSAVLYRWIFKRVVSGETCRSDCRASALGGAYLSNNPSGSRRRQRDWREVCFPRHLCSPQRYSASCLYGLSWGTRRTRIPLGLRGARSRIPIPQSDIRPGLRLLSRQLRRKDGSFKGTGTDAGTTLQTEIESTQVGLIGIGDQRKWCVRSSCRLRGNKPPDVLAPRPRQSDVPNTCPIRREQFS
jgi:hypothetical protein